MGARGETTEGRNQCVSEQEGQALISKEQKETGDATCGP